MGNMTAVSSSQRNTAVHDGSSTCIVEPDLYFNEFSSVFQRKEFLGRQCCETCQSDPECLYAMTDGRDCWVASHLVPDAVGILSTEHARSVLTAFWVDDSTKRGDFCDRCDCREEDLTIDCRGRDLAIVPKTFLGNSGDGSDDSEPSLPWNPKVVDLSGNPRLAVLGSDSLLAISEYLEEIVLPHSMSHVAVESVRNLPRLERVAFSGISTTEDASVDGPAENHLTNMILSTSGEFNHICCGLGQNVALSLPAGGMTFCDMRVDLPGADAIFEEFIEYQGAKPILSLTPSSRFMAEAAESAEKCAEYCALSDDCRFFTYDARLPNAEHVCLLLANNGTNSKEVCCQKDHFADEEALIPGFISGRPPQTRHEIDNAVVLMSTTNLRLEPRNNYKTQFEVSLGSNPLRGAVWIEPTLAASITNLDVTISPPRVALYDANTAATVTIELLSKPDASDATVTLVVNNAIESCDVAFIPATGSSEQTVYVEVIPPSQSFFQSLNIWVSAIILLLAALFSLGIFIYFWKKQTRNDAVWRVDKKELHFADPPEIVGRGTFGLVILAEYRGTQVRMYACRHSIWIELDPTSLTTVLLPVFPGCRQTCPSTQRSNEEVEYFRFNDATEI